MKPLLGDARILLPFTEGLGTFGGGFIVLTTTNGREGNEDSRSKI